MADQEDQSLSGVDVDAATAGLAGDAARQTPPAPVDGAGSEASLNPPQAEADTPLAEEPMDQGGLAEHDADQTDPATSFSQADIDSALNGSADAAAAVETATEEAQRNSADKPFDEIAAAMTAEIEKAANAASVPQSRSTAPPPGLSEAASLELGAFRESTAEAGAMAQGIGLLSDVELQVKIELGRTHKTVEEVLALGTGSVVELDRLAGDPVDILVNERLVARGEVLVLNDNLCIRVNEIVSRQVG
ncbi:MAG: flagellar motor switch protein FliN [Phycisphaerales bacterium]|nr:MAG: flagellar motor switch protein FliN [Phycisphaerales bacterium]